MATCKDCVHVEVCKDFMSSLIEGLELDKSDVELINKELNQDDADKGACDHFWDRARFVELLCAEWIEDEDMYGEPIFRCSNCNERFVLEEGTPLDNCYFYCPNCGAKMDEQDMKEREKNGQGTDDRESD